MIKLLSTCVILVMLFNSCAKSTSSENEVYNNDFENNNLTNIVNGVISPFNGSHVLGNYNNAKVELLLKALPAHDMVEISFDLLIHDTWEGSQSLENNLNGPDFWQMKVDNQMHIYATFANFYCVPGFFCPGQSYPENYPAQNNNPKTGAASIELPGFCSEKANPNGTTLYQIRRTISHSGSNLSLELSDKLMQKDAVDPKCDESWSVDNIKIKVIQLN